MKKKLLPTFLTVEITESNSKKLIEYGNSHSTDF